MSYQEFIDLREKHESIRITGIALVLLAGWLALWGWVFRIADRPDPGSTAAAPVPDVPMTWMDPPDADFMRIWTPSLFAMPQPRAKVGPDLVGVNRVPSVPAPPVRGVPPLPPAPAGPAGPRLAGPVSTPAASSPPRSVFAGEKFFRGGIVAAWTGQRGERVDLPVPQDLAAAWIGEDTLGWEAVFAARRTSAGWLDQVKIEERIGRPDLDETLRVWVAGRHVPGPADAEWGTVRIRYLPERVREAPPAGGGS